MKLIVFIILLAHGLVLNALGQVEEPCQLAQKKARRLVSDGEIYFPRTIVNFSLTLLKMMEVDYGIKDEVYDNGTDEILDNEDSCFFKVMKDEIERKWGKGFLITQSGIADKLEREDKGYFKPKENGIRDSLKKYVRENASKRDIKKGYLIVLKISPDRKLEDYKVYFGFIRPEPIEKESDDFLFIGKALSSVTVNCEPGRFRGKPIESFIRFYLDF